MIVIHRGRIFNEQRTPAKEEFPAFNRRQRRALLYGSKVRRLLYKVNALRREMRKAGIQLPPPPRFHNRKYLSGYCGRLIEEAMK